MVILPEMDGVRPRLTSYSEYLDTDKTSLVPQSGQKCRLREILSAKNGTNCNFYDKYESFLRCFNYFKPANFFQSVTKFVMNDKTAKNWHKMMIRKSNETMNIAEKKIIFILRFWRRLWSLEYDFLMFSSSSEVLSGMITWKCKNYIQGQKMTAIFVFFLVWRQWNYARIR